jgi:hypothetical protein
MRMAMDGATIGADSVGSCAIASVPTEIIGVRRPRSDPSILQKWSCASDAHRRMARPLGRARPDASYRLFRHPEGVAACPATTAAIGIRRGTSRQVGRTPSGSHLETMATMIVRVARDDGVLLPRRRRIFDANTGRLDGI